MVKVPSYNLIFVGMRLFYDRIIDDKYAFGMLILFKGRLNKGPKLFGGEVVFMEEPSYLVLTKLIFQQLS